MVSGKPVVRDRDFTLLLNSLLQRFRALSSDIPSFNEAGVFQGYIFDVEGTLVDSVPQNLRSLQEALEEAGIEMP